jgi:hypothetical protein
MKRRTERNDNEPNKREKRSIIDISSFDSLSQDTYDGIFQKTGDYRSLFPLLFVSKTFNDFTKQFLNNNYNNEIKSFYYTNLFCNYLGETNQINLLKWLYSISCLFSPKIFYIVSSNNNNNNLDLLKWLLKIFKQKDSILKKYFIKKYCRKDCFLEKIVYGAAQKNNIYILQFIKETYLFGKNSKKKYSENFFESIIKGTAKGNQLKLLKSMIYPGKGTQLTEKEKSLNDGIFLAKSKTDKKILLKASKHGSLEILKFHIKKMLQNHSLNSIRNLCVEIFDEAFIYGHIKIIEWIIDKKYINKSHLFKESEPIEIFDLINYDVGKEYSYSVCQRAILKGSICSLEWAFNRDILEKKDCLLGPKLFQYMAQERRIDLLNFLKSHELIYNDSTCAGAVLSGSLQCLYWAIKNGHPTSFWVSACAAFKGNIEILEWLYENGHPINFISTVYSILAGKESTTQWLIDHGFSLTTNNLIFAFSENNRDERLQTIRNISNRQIFYSYWINTKKKDCGETAMLDI